MNNYYLAGIVAERGEFADVWCDPITKTKLEGAARLVRQTYRDGECQRWQVRFLGESETVERTFFPRPEQP